MLFLYGALPEILILVSRDADYSGSDAVSKSPAGSNGYPYNMNAQPTYYELSVDSVYDRHNVDGDSDAFSVDLPTEAEQGSDSDSSENLT